MKRPAGPFDASRYFRGGGDLGFYNVGTAAVRMGVPETYYLKCFILRRVE